MGGWEVQTHRWQITNSITFFTVKYTTWVSLSPACKRFFAFLPWNRNNRITISHVHQWRTLPVGGTGNLQMGEPLVAHPPISTVTAWQQDEKVTNYPATVQLVLNQTRSTSPGSEERGKRESKIYLKVIQKLCFSCQLFPPNPVQEAASYRISLRPFGEIQQQFSVKKKMVNCKMKI